VRPSKAVHLFVFDGFADWEPANALAELRRKGHYRIEVVALTKDPVESMGGLSVLPTQVLTDEDDADVRILILTGGDSWEHGDPPPQLVALLERLATHDVPIAAICAATTAVVRLGPLRGRKHTSNGLSYLRSQVPEYQQEADYVHSPAVRDRGLITASGLAPIEFARELFEELDVLSPEDRARWAVHPRPRAPVTFRIF
jgi:putative intracellular protease/amidase